mgnify:FL=1
MTYKRWDVVAVHFPFLEGTDSKRRPALVISADKLQSEHALYWIAMITTAKSGQRPKDIVVSDRVRAGLPEPCVIRVPRIAMVSDHQIARRLGDLAPKDRNTISALLKQYMP